MHRVTAGAIQMKRSDRLTVRWLVGQVICVTEFAIAPWRAVRARQVQGQLRSSTRQDFRTSLLTPNRAGASPSRRHRSEERFPPVEKTVNRSKLVPTTSTSADRTRLRETPAPDAPRRS